ncbi:FeoA family protein [Vagococcus zengguangii]|uniref:Ferrous iron transport protein A n=1 Tax=Vagococcus zengguangii TaxID=2571750 RepID=A0A4D7CVC0_9ENTE|nr:FeoA family protein [Vagococcus zengguangii]QCI86257.1 ferrous iron transport protein A [Vagococcus zengguangii]TLG79636.1 ferrous iron transport protein A [Vagococcus zengguangii]
MKPIHLCEKGNNYKITAVSNDIASKFPELLNNNWYLANKTSHRLTLTNQKSYQLTIKEAKQILAVINNEADKFVSLSDLSTNQIGTIVGINHRDTRLKKHLMEMGFTTNTTVKLRKRAPLGDPLELELRGYSISLRKADAQHILVKEVAK